MKNEITTRVYWEMSQRLPGFQHVFFFLHYSCLSSFYTVSLYIQMSSFKMMALDCKHCKLSSVDNVNQKKYFTTSVHLKRSPALYVFKNSPQTDNDSDIFMLQNRKGGRFLFSQIYLALPKYPIFCLSIYVPYASRIHGRS